MKDEEIKQIFCGANHSGILKNDGKVLIWGQNECKPI